MRIQSGWYRQRRTASQRRVVTGDAPALRPAVAGQVLRVIEADIEILFKAIGKAFALRVVAIHSLMTDRTEGNIRRRELGQMTAGAILMAGETRPHRVVRTMVTARASERRVLRTRVLKF
jgi:hypothetical protein